VSHCYQNFVETEEGTSNSLARLSLKEDGPSISESAACLLLHLLWLSEVSRLVYVLFVFRFKVSGLLSGGLLASL